MEKHSVGIRGLKVRPCVNNLPYSASPSKNAVSANIKHSRYFHIKHLISGQFTPMVNGGTYIRLIK